MKQTNWHRKAHKLWPLYVMALLLLLLSSSSAAWRDSQAQSTPHAHITVKSASKTTLATHPSSAQTQTDTPDNTDMALLRQFSGPNGWIWRTSLPMDRLVIYYGNPGSTEMGPLGAYSDDELVARLQAQAQVYGDLDPIHPVVPAFDYVTPVAQPVPMSDGSWVYRMPDDSIRHYIDLANTNHMLFFFDMQIGHSTIQKEVGILWQYLQMPGVELALDPEFDMDLPPKILIIHQFLQEMLPDWQKIKVQPGVQVVTCVDGFGPPGSKIDDYVQFDREQLIQYLHFI